MVTADLCCLRYGTCYLPSIRTTSCEMHTKNLQMAFYYLTLTAQEILLCHVSFSISRERLVKPISRIRSQTLITQQTPPTLLQKPQPEPPSTPPPPNATRRPFSNHRPPLPLPDHNLLVRIRPTICPFPRFRSTPLLYRPHAHPLVLETVLDPRLDIMRAV